MCNLSLAIEERGFEKGVENNAARPIAFTERNGYTEPIGTGNRQKGKQAMARTISIGNQDFEIRKKGVDWIEEGRGKNATTIQRANRHHSQGLPAAAV